ncbi:MAG: hypothetical protein S4CHLAM102_02930 [Chlamydiia bacterium]|nr:hypothetical protein [Chlamydiia bacterium]
MALLQTGNQAACGSPIVLGFPHPIAESNRFETFVYSKIADLKTVRWMNRELHLDLAVEIVGQCPPMPNCPEYTYERVRAIAFVIQGFAVRKDVKRAQIWFNKVIDSYPDKRIQQILLLAKAQIAIAHAQNGNMYRAAKHLSWIPTSVESVGDRLEEREIAKVFERTHTDCVLEIATYTYLSGLGPGEAFPGDLNQMNTFRHLINQKWMEFYSELGRAFAERGYIECARRWKSGFERHSNDPLVTYCKANLRVGIACAWINRRKFHKAQKELSKIKHPTANETVNARIQRAWVMLATRNT